MNTVKNDSRGLPFWLTVALIVALLLPYIWPHRDGTDARLSGSSNAFEAPLKTNDQNTPALNEEQDEQEMQIDQAPIKKENTREPLGEVENLLNAR